MKLYHFTSVTLAEAILSSSINQGRLNRQNNEIIEPVVWLTSDLRHTGHGLLTGKDMVDPENIATMERVQGRRLKNLKVHDKTQIRLTVEIPEEETGTLQSFVDYCSINEGKLFAKYIGLTALFELGGMEKLSDQKLMRLYKTAKTKEATWWLSWTPVLASFITAVDFNADGKFVPYSFEHHGRRHLRENGQVVVSSDAIQDLSRHMKPMHQFELPKAFCMCLDPSGNPTVAIRGEGKTLGFDLKSEKWILGEPGEKRGILEDWIRHHRQELDQCWLSAIERYYAFYPDKRPTSIVTA